MPIPAPRHGGAALGYVVTVKRSRETWSARYLLDGAVQAIERGEIEVVGKGPLGDALLSAKGRSKLLPKSTLTLGLR